MTRVEVAYGPGERPKLALNEWRARFRDQQVAIRLAQGVCREWVKEHGPDAAPATQLFETVFFAARDSSLIRSE